MKKYIVIRTQFPMLHYWKDAKNFLKHEHRHMFYVECKLEITHNDREVEFIEFKEIIEDYIRECFWNKVLHYSCEDICEILIGQFGLSYCSVFEDNENGAEIWVK